MAIIEEQVIARRRVFELAAEMVDPIVKQHGLEKYTHQVNIFTTSFVSTPVDQHLTHIMSIADWLMQEGN